MRCECCGRRLTDPESIAERRGKKCRKRRGLTWPLPLRFERAIDTDKPLREQHKDAVAIIDRKL